MKKMLALLFALALTASISFAQAAGAATDDKKTTTITETKTTKKTKKGTKKAAKKEKAETKTDTTTEKK